MTVNYIGMGRAWVLENYRWLLIVVCIPLFSTKALFNLPLGIMAILAVIHLFRDWQALRTDVTVRTMLILFLCIWLPLLLSLPGAVEFGRSASTVARYLLLILVGIFIIQSCRIRKVRVRVYYSVIVLVTLMCIDGLVQFFLGNNLLGYPMVQGRVTGIFYPKLHIGLLLAVLSPVVIEFTLNTFRRNILVMVLPILVLIMLLLAGNRVSWLMFMMSMSVYIVYRYMSSDTRVTWRSLAGGLAVLLIALFIAYKSPFVQSRVNETAGVFSSDFKTMDRATAYRLSIWQVGWSVYRANWLNGIGPRGFRYVFTEYADKDNFWSAQDGRGVTHPHLMILEVAVETGTIGLIGYLLFFVFLFRFFRQSDRGDRVDMFPWLLSVLIAFFPLNAHMALYASYWGALSWWLLVLALGMSGMNRQQTQEVS